jgi:hypothetical protein
MNTLDAMLTATALPARSRPEFEPTRATAEGLTPLALRVRGEFAEMPGLRLTAPQAARLFGIELGVAQAVLDELRRASVLARSVTECTHCSLTSLYVTEGAHETKMQRWLKAWRNRRSTAR